MVLGLITNITTFAYSKWDMIMLLDPHIPSGIAPKSGLISRRKTS